MNVCIVGLGYMGLPTALLIASKDCRVTGYDIDKRKIKLLNQGQLPFDEDGLHELYEKNKQYFYATDTLVGSEPDVYIISVPTPFTADKKCDLSHVVSAAEYIAPHVKEGALVILESTVSPGTTINVVKPIIEAAGHKINEDFFLAYVSEKAIPGNTLYEMVHNDRIIGAFNEIAAEKTKQIYSKFVKGILHFTDCTTAETVKLVENTYRDINIAFANELANICCALGINVWDVIKYANRHPRVNVHSPGPGVGGHCIAIDPWFLIEDHLGPMVQMGRRINDSRPDHVADKILEICKKRPMKFSRVAVLGVAYKPDVDDARESPAIEIIANLCKHGISVSIHDPFVKIFPYQISTNLDDIIASADIIVIVTDHKIYRENPSKFDGKIVIDTRNIGIPNSILLGRDF